MRLIGISTTSVALDSGAVISGLLSPQDIVVDDMLLGLELDGLGWLYQA
jgi:hypothetical protein